MPPASTMATEILGCSERRLATAQPPEPPPTTTKSNVSVTLDPPKILLSPGPLAGLLAWRLGFCASSGKRERLRRFSRRICPFLASQNPQKSPPSPFQSGQALVHTPRCPKGICQGLPSQEASGQDPSARFARWPNPFRHSVFLRGRATAYRGVEQPGSSSGS